MKTNKLKWKKKGKGLIAIGYGDQDYTISCTPVKCIHKTKYRLDFAFIGFSLSNYSSNLQFLKDWANQHHEHMLKTWRGNKCISFEPFCYQSTNQI